MNLVIILSTVDILQFQNPMQFLYNFVGICHSKISEAEGNQCGLDANTVVETITDKEQVKERFELCSHKQSWNGKLLRTLFCEWSSNILSSIGLSLDAKIWLTVECYHTWQSFTLCWNQDM